MKKHLIAIGCIAAILGPLAVQAKGLRIENKRDVALTELTIVAKDGAKDGGAQQSYVLARDLPAGRVINSAVPANKCLFDVKGTFADQSTLAADDMNLCAQNTIRLVK